MAFATILNKQTRNAGTWTGASVAVLPTVSGFSARALMNAGDLADTALAVRIQLEASDDPTASTWHNLISVVWQGGVPGRDGLFHPPSMSYSTTSPLPLWVRAVVDTNLRISVGLEAEIL